MEYVSYVRLVFSCCFLCRGTCGFATRDDALKNVQARGYILISCNTVGPTSWHQRRPIERLEYYSPVPHVHQPTSWPVCLTGFTGAQIGKMLIRLPSACRGRPAVQFPANSSHTCCVELTLKGVLYTCLGRKRPLNTWALIRVNSFSWLPRPWWYGCAHALGTGRASFQFFFFQFP